MNRLLPFILLFIFLHPPELLAGDILAVQSMAVKPYNEALKGCRSVLRTRTQRILSTEMSEEEVVAKVRDTAPSLILAIGQDALAKVRMIRDVPIVYLMVLNPQSLVREGGNITGVSMNVAPDRQLSLLRQILPRSRRIGVMYDPDKSGNFVARAHDAAVSLDLDLFAKGVHSPREAVCAVNAMKGKIDTLWLLPDTTVIRPETIDLLLLFSIENRIPVFTFSEKYAEKGALIALEVDPEEVGREAGEMANRILAGADVKGIETQDAHGGVLTVNLIVAKKLGLAVNINVIKQARVIK